MTSEGNGVGRIEDIAVFVPNTAIGDYAEIKIVKVLKSYAFGRLERIISPSESRIEVDCPVFEKCGGCSYRHINYIAETELKKEQVFHNIKTIGKVDFEPCNIVFDADRTLGYRNKGQFPATLDENSKITFGFFANRSHRVIPCKNCLLQPNIFADILSFIEDFVNQRNITCYNEQTHKGNLRHIYIRRAEETRQIMVCFVVNGNTFTDDKLLAKSLCDKFPDIKSVVLNVNTENTNVILGKKCVTLFGNDTIDDFMCGIKVRLSPLSFYQVNHNMAQKLYEIAGMLADLKGNETLLDLYCGAGTIGLSLARKVKKIYGIEIIPDAVENARYNAEINNVSNAEFICSDASAVKKLIEKDGVKFDVAIVDPPRKGCSADVLQALCSSNAEKIVMVSCNSATLSRDIEFLSSNGYNLSKVIPVDLFPRTTHVETVALLGRKQVEYRVEFDVDVTDLKKPTRKRATYPEIKEYVKERFGLNVSSLNIAQVKDKCGLGKRENYYKGKDGHRVPNCPEEKEKAIIETFKHFGMV